MSDIRLILTSYRRSARLGKTARGGWRAGGGARMMGPTGEDAMETRRLTLAEVHALTARVLEANGCDAPNAEAVAANMTAVEREVGRSHGLFRLPGHVAMLRAGQANGRADPTVEQVAPALLRVEAGGGFAPLALDRGLPALADLARAQGLAALGIREAVHYSALWPEVARLAAEGLIGLAVTATPPYVAPAGGRRPFFGTNPMAFAWPRAGAPPMVWDQASAAMARGEVMLAAKEGRAVPETAGVDASGAPTADPAAIIEGGAQLPFGGHKGAAIALMVDLLAGPLLDQPASFETPASEGAGGPAPGGEFVLAIDPARLGGEAGFARAERLFAALEAEEGARLPGAARAARRAETERDGVAVPAALLAEVEALGSP
jgi:delta1-piperideine-2-carboxylate reductase